jgi:AcrR family transcriptional regulator
MTKSERTKQRLLEAATAEFARFGLAGARVDRIAAAAGCNKQLIYAYFDSKDRLFDAVYDRMVVATVQSVPIDASDLPAYAANLFDRYRAHPEVLRLAYWHGLEKGDGVSSAAVAATAEKVAAIGAAQEAGIVTHQYDAAGLLDLLLCMSKVGADSSPEASAPQTATSRLRSTLVDAVKRLVEPS